MTTTTTLRRTLAERVQAGADLLDGVTPGWRSRVNADTLDMDTSFDCVLGQLFGSYWDGTRELRMDRDIEQRAAYGFTANASSVVEDFTCDDLTAEWRKQLA